MAYFSNRIEAGSRLAEALKEFAGDGGVVLAIPRGGVVVGYEIAQRLHLELDVIVPRKLGAPRQSGVGNWCNHGRRNRNSG